MRAVRFRELLASPGPFASVYFDESHPTSDTDVRLDLRWHGLREQLEHLGADKSVTEVIRQAVLEWRRPTSRRGGRAVVAGPDGVVVNENLLRPTDKTVVRVSELPYIVPILEHGYENPDYLLAMVDSAGADINVYVDGEPGSESVEGSPDLVAKRMTELLDRTLADAAFVAGRPQSRADLLAALPIPASDQVVSLPVFAPRGEYDLDELRWAIEAWFSNRSRRALDDAAERFDAEAGRRSGRAAEGLSDVCRALRQNTVETLIIGDVGDAVVVSDEDLTAVAPHPDCLRRQGVAPARVLRADEALPLLAISSDASLVRTDERIAPSDGIAAVLRSGPRE